MASYMVYRFRDPKSGLIWNNDVLTPHFSNKIPQMDFKTKKHALRRYTEYLVRNHSSNTAIITAYRYRFQTNQPDILELIELEIQETELLVSLLPIEDMISATYLIEFNELFTEDRYSDGCLRAFFKTVIEAGHVFDYFIEMKKERNDRGSKYDFKDHDDSIQFFLKNKNIRIKSQKNATFVALNEPEYMVLKLAGALPDKIYDFKNKKAYLKS